MLFPFTYIYANSEDEAYQLGYKNGWVDGIKKAEIDYLYGNNKNYIRVMPNSTEIIEMYNLKIKSNQYRSNFISGYKSGFKEGYNMAYENPSDDRKTSNFLEELGYTMGKLQGYIDFHKGESNKWTRNIPTTSDIMNMFNLMEESKDYKSNFISTFSIKYKEGYEHAYRLAKYEPYKATLNKGAEDGKMFGKILGSNYGKLDYYSGNTNHWERHIPSDNEIISMFLLNNDNTDYISSFIASFKSDYRNSYEEAYRKANVEYNTFLFEKGYSNGKNIGLAKGEYLAKIDLTSGNNNNSSKLNLSDKDIINEYELHKENNRYNEGFISGYREGLKIGYNSLYEDLKYRTFINKNITQIIPKSGGEIKSGDNDFSIKIDKGVFYNEVVVSIEKILITDKYIMPSKDRFIKASDCYDVKIISSSNSVNPKKLIKLSFEYYGSDNGGIYRYKNGQWEYVPSNIDSNSINTYINPDTLNNNNQIYAVFIDNKATNPNDIKGHWAKNEIITYLRRGIIGTYQDNSFKPDVPLTWGQAISYINKIYDKKLILNKSFDDPISYKDMENLMKLATENPEFSWNSVAEKIKWDKDKLSSSYRSMDNYITRSETIYMFYYLNQ